MQQQLFQRGVGQRQQQHIHGGHHDGKIAGVQHRGLGQQHKGRVDQPKQDVELDGQAKFPAKAAGDDIFVLIEAEEGGHEGQKHKTDGLHPVPRLVGDDDVQQAIGDKPCQHNADGQRQQISYKYIGVLQLFAL